jgi:hypothetical protein
LLIWGHRGRRTRMLSPTIVISLLARADEVIE